jgi:hypothetical protein
VSLLLSLSRKKCRQITRAFNYKQLTSPQKVMTILVKEVIFILTIHPHCGWRHDTLHDDTKHYGNHHISPKCYFQQGTLAKGEVSIQLTPSLRLLVLQKRKKSLLKVDDLN